MKKKYIGWLLFLCTLFAVLTLAVFTASAEEGSIISGTCGAEGDNLTWTFDPATGALVISGAGAMQNYSTNNFPWYSYKSQVRSIEIQDGVTHIGDCAFYNTYWLSDISIGRDVKSIGWSAFVTTSYQRPTRIHIKDLAAWCNIKFASEYSNPTMYSYGLFLNGEEIRDLVIPDSVTEIASFAFFGCDRIKTVFIGDQVTRIGEKTFSNCDSLTDLYIGSGMETMDKDAFNYMESLTSVYITNLPGWCAIDFKNGYSNPLYETEKLYINNVLVTDLLIPEGVPGVSRYAFYKSDFLKSVTIPDSVTFVDDYAFYECNNLTSVSFGKGIKRIGCSAFGGCRKLESISLPDSLDLIDIAAFRYCSALTAADLGKGIERIGEDAFYNCSKLESVSIPASARYIDANAFRYCSAMSEISISSGLTHMGDYALANCSSLTTVTIPDSVTRLNGTVFSRCTNLDDIWVDSDNQNYSSDQRGVLFDKDKTLIIKCPEAEKGDYALPGSVLSVDGGAFSYCANLTGITFPAGLEQISDSGISYCGSLKHIHFRGEMPQIGTNCFTNCAEDLYLCRPVAAGWEECSYDTCIYGYINNGEDHTLDCPNCEFAYNEAHTFVDGECICGAKWDPIDEPQLIFSTKTLSLRNYICFDFTVHNSVLEHYDSWFVIFERYDHELDSIVTTRVESEDFFNHQLLEIKLCSYQMADPFTATLYAVKDGIPYRGEVYTNSVAGYVNENIANATSDAHRTLYANLVTYGAKAQIYMNYNTENLADAGLGEYASYVTTTIPTPVTVFSETDKGLTGVTLNRTALGIASAVELQLALNISDEYDATELYAEMVYTRSNGETITERVEGKDFLDWGVIHVCIFHSLTAVDGRTPVEVTVYDQSGNAVSETWTYSIVSYQYNSPLTGAALDTLHALINYFDAAEVYFSETEA